MTPTVQISFSQPFILNFNWSIKKASLTIIMACLNRSKKTSVTQSLTKIISYKVPSYSIVKLLSINSSLNRTIAVLKCCSFLQCCVVWDGRITHQKTIKIKAYAGISHLYISRQKKDNITHFILRTGVTVVIIHLNDDRLNYFLKVLIVIYVGLAMLLEVPLLQQRTHQTSLSNPPSSHGPYLSIITDISFNFDYFEFTTQMHKSWYHCHVTTVHDLCQHVQSWLSPSQQGSNAHLFSSLTGVVQYLTVNFNNALQ